MSKGFICWPGLVKERVVHPEIPVTTTVGPDLSVGWNEPHKVAVLDESAVAAVLRDNKTDTNIRECVALEDSGLNKTSIDKARKAGVVFEFHDVRPGADRDQDGNLLTIEWIYCESGRRRGSLVTQWGPKKKAKAPDKTEGKTKEVEA